MVKTSHVWEHIRTAPGLKRNVLTLIALLVVGIMTIAYYLLQFNYQFPWDKKYVFSADFSDASGVAPAQNQEVRIAGVPAGRIVEAQPISGGKARLTMALEPGHQIYTNARALLRTKTPINIMYVELNPGGPPEPPLPDGGLIPLSQTQRPTQAYELLNHLDARTRDALTAFVDEADTALVNAPTDLPPGLRSVDTTLSTLRPVVAQLQARRQTLARLVTALGHIGVAVGGDKQRLTRLVAAAQDSLGVLSARDSELAQTLDELPGFTTDLHRAVRDTDRLTTQLNPTLDDLRAATDSLPDALARTTDTVDEAKKLARTARPVLDRAGPVLTDLKPASRDLNTSLPDLVHVIGLLPRATQSIAPWMPDLAAFVYQTSSVFSLSDANGGFGRGQVTLDLRDPSGGIRPQPGVKPNSDRINNSIHPGQLPEFRQPLTNALRPGNHR